MAKKQLARERRIRRSRSRWLQKALFALSKVEKDSEKLADLRGEKSLVRDVTIHGESFPLDAVTEAVGDAVHEWLEEERNLAASVRRRCDADPAFGYAILRCFTPVITQRLQATRLRVLDLYAPPAQAGRFEARP